jgi:hypothetical protein
VTATTDTSGVFVVSIQSGRWRAVVAHPKFDSLRVTLPPRELEVSSSASAVTGTLWTPSRLTITRMLCGDSAKPDDAALTGVVRDAATHGAIDSASVFVKWVNLNLALQRGKFVRSTETQTTRTTRDGWYVTCGVPSAGTLLSWAEQAGAVSGTVPVTLEGAPARLDISLDLTARRSGGSIDLEPDSSGASLFPTARGNARYRVLVRDPNGRPVSNARVRILGERTVRTNDAGSVTLDSVAAGTQTLEVLAIGYQPQRRTVDIAPRREPTDTFVLAALLDTIRVTAGRDPTGFERRRNAGAGQFISADDVERENPARTTQLLRTRDGLRFTFDRNGFPYIEVTTQDSRCRPRILLDGFPSRPVPTVPGEAEMDWLVHPDEIGGVEIYTNSAKIPPEIARWGRTCAVIAFWTRKSLGLPKAESLQP